MMVSKWGVLAGAMLLAAGLPGSRALAQDRDSLFRAVDIVSRSVQIGATVSDIDTNDAKQPKAGVLVETITPDGPAEKAGIKSGDAITEFDGERVRSVRQFLRLVQESAAGKSVAVTLSRAGQRVNVNLTPERRSRTGDSDMRLMDLPRAARIPTPAPPAMPRAPRPPAFETFRFEDFPGVVRLVTGRRLGMTTESIDDQLAEYFGVKEGVLVKSVLDGSAAQKAGVKAGDVLTGINGTKIYDSSDINRALERIEGDGAFTLDVMRERKPVQLKGKIEPQTRTRTRAQTGF